MGRHRASGEALLDAVADQRETDLAAILNGSASEVTQRKLPPIADSLLDRLLRGIPPAHTEVLVTCSAARDKEAALRLADDSGLHKRAPGAKAEMFGARFWLESPVGPGEVLHPVLRRLLLRRLAARPADAKANWTTVHSWLQKDAEASGDQVGQLYHALALSDVKGVACQLTETEEVVTGTEAWLGLLETVAAAPNALDDKSKTIDQVEVLTEWTEESDVSAAVASAGALTAAMWIDADPLSDPHRPALRGEIRSRLYEVAGLLFRAGGAATIRRYADNVHGDDPGAADQAGPEPVLASFVPPKSGRGIQRARRARALAAARSPSTRQTAAPRRPSRRLRERTPRRSPASRDTSLWRCWTC
jgi:hypothetical protein